MGEWNINADEGLERAAKIEWIFLDVDGVLTDGTLLYDANGIESKRFHTHDGHGIRMAQRAGIKFGLITGRRSPIVSSRAQELEIEEVHQRILNKGERFQEIKARLGLENDRVAYMGDDLIDLPILTQVGLAGAPQNALPDIRERVHWVSRYSGGAGAVREYIELIMKARGLWDEAVLRYGIGV